MTAGQDRHSGAFRGNSLSHRGKMETFNQENSKERRPVNKQSRIFRTGLPILALTLFLSGSSPATSASTAAGSPKDVCLGCHGPFDELTSATANYTMPVGGEKTSPHRYVPHDSKDIPECNYCHKPHPVPLTSKEEVPKPNPQWCYTCHHKRVVKACGTCH